MKYILLFLTLSGCSANLTTSTDAKAANIEITREILLEAGRFPEPKTLAKSASDDYVIAGQDTLRPWATRVDAQGRVKWRHVVDIDRSKVGVQGSYEGAVALSDETTVLCGTRHEVNQGRSVAFITHIDPVGKILNSREMYPQQDTGARLNEFLRCIPWGDGLVVLGYISRLTRQREEPVFQNYVWLLALNERSEVRWERLFSDIVLTSSIDITAFNNRDLLIVSGSQITIVDPAGNVKKQKTLPSPNSGKFTLVRDADATSTKLSLFPVFNKERIVLWDLDDNLGDIRQLTGPGAPFVAHRAYRLKSGELVLFGSQFVSEVATGAAENTAGISKLTKDVQRRENFFFRPLWVSNDAVEALPTAESNSFVVVRQMHPIPRWPDEKRRGVMLTFVRIN